MSETSLCFFLTKNRTLKLNYVCLWFQNTTFQPMHIMCAALQSTSAVYMRVSLCFHYLRVCGAKWQLAGGGSNLDKETQIYTDVHTACAYILSVAAVLLWWCGWERRGNMHLWLFRIRSTYRYKHTVSALDSSQSDSSESKSIDIWCQLWRGVKTSATKTSTLAEGCMRELMCVSLTLLVWMCDLFFKLPWSQ